MPNTEQPEPMKQPETMDLATAQRVEQDKLTRRAALRKLGFGAGLAAFSLLGVDDFARMAGKRMERIAGDNKVARQLAKEFQSVGIAFANPSNALPAWAIGEHCKGNHNSYGPAANCADCCANGCKGDYASGDAEAGCEQTAVNYCS